MTFIFRKHSSVFYWHYAWVIVAIAASMQLLGASSRMVFGVLIDPMTQTFGWSQGAITMAYAINSVVSALASPSAGWLGDKYGERKATALGGAMFVAGMVITGMIKETWQFYLSFGVLLGVAQAIFLVPLIPGVMRWYRRQLGWGMGVLMAAWGVGPALTAPLMGYLMVRLDWQTAFWTAGFGSAFILVILIYFYRNDPADIGTDPYGMLPGETSPPNIVIDKFKVKTFVSYMKRTAAYYNMSAIHFLGCVGHAIILVYLIPMITLEQISLVSASLVITIMHVASTPSRMITPVLCEKAGVKTVMFWFIFFQGVTVFMLFWTHELWMFYFFAVVFGIGYGGENGGFPILNRKYYGHAPQGSPYGFQMLGAGLGMALGGWIGGAIFDLTGGYNIALAISITASLFGAFFVLLLEPTDDLLIPDWEVSAVPET